MSIAETPTSKSGDLQRSLFTSVSSVGSDGEQDAFESTSSDSSDASLGDFFSDKKWNFSGSSLQGMGQIPAPVLPPGRSYSVDLTSSQPPLMSRPLQTRVSVSGPVHRECLPIIRHVVGHVTTLYLLWPICCYGGLLDKRATPVTRRYAHHCC